MSITACDHPATLRHEERDALGIVLCWVLVDLTDLALAAEQLHWNVVGPGLRPLHLQLDELVESVRDLADQVAERAPRRHAAEYDAATQDLLNQAIQVLEQHAWMFSAQRRAAARVRP
jgi:DNA-binding ferritin-like protein